MEITEYVMDFREVRIVGDQAFEWACTSLTVKPKGAGTDFHASGNLMRILRKQQDWNWKVARAIWNDNPSLQKTAPRQQER
jgi:ketosteroid isomerase-like protein